VKNLEKKFVWLNFLEDELKLQKNIEKELFEDFVILWNFVNLRIFQ
jgi:hypothetical protein